MHSTEVKFLRKIEGKSRQDRIRKSTFRKNLKIKPTLQIVEERQMRWFGYINRMGENSKTDFWGNDDPEELGLKKLKRQWKNEMVAAKRLNKKCKTEKNGKRCGGKNPHNNSTPKCFTPEKVERHQH
jgi:hypothetical protein